MAESLNGSKKWKLSEDGLVVVVPLKVPVEHNKETISEIKLRAVATVQDLEAMDRGKGEVNQTIHLLAELSGLSLTLMRKLRAADFATVSEAAGAIMGNEESQPIGKTP